MQNHIPYKNLTRLTWILSALSSIVVFIFYLAISHEPFISLMRFLQAFVLMAITGFCNLGLLKAFSFDPQNPNRYDKIKYYTASYLSTIPIWFFVKSLYSVITQTRWEGEGSNHIIMAYSLAFLAVWVLNTLILFLHNMVMLQSIRAQGEIENLQLKANLSETANLLLRQQIHPHFLFNALNTIKSLYKTDLQQGEEYLVHLANFLRMSISNHGTKTTLIKNELEFCLYYLKMQKIRFGAALDYSIAIPEQSINNQYLPYFSLQPLVENALKHNDLTAESPMLITIKEIDGYICVSNNLQPKSYKETSTGQGLSNLAERYRLLDEEEILITSDHSFFTVRMKILNKPLSLHSDTM